MYHSAYRKINFDIDVINANNGASELRRKLDKQAEMLQKGFSTYNRELIIFSLFVSDIAPDSKQDQMLLNLLEDFSALDDRVVDIWNEISEGLALLE
jgi:hypothetical protein